VLALFVFVLAALTDYWDGVFARRMKEVSSFGKLMDPITDKMLTLSAFFSFWYLGVLPLWMVLVVVAREAAVTVARFFMPADSPGFAAQMSGKIKTVLQIVYIIAVLLYLVARQVPDWQASWNEQATVIARLGMLVIVVLTVWSGVKVFKK
jgi:CDP-diacylglycerol--glycerol-3-phosphate 3-phosphatidyltransferase